ncbi:hypothetical protein ACNOYE_00130 [Nannocystaceae bacterium ST9]
MSDADCQQIISAWERGRGAPGHERALLLAELALGGEADLASLPIGARDHAIAEHRIGRRGPIAQASMVCPACSEGMEFRVDFAQVCGLGCERSSGPRVLEHEGFVVRFRLPSTADLRAIAERERSGGSGRALLIERIVVGCERLGDRSSASALPESVIAALEAEIERLDPISDIRFTQACPACEHRFVAPFDVARFCWQELEVDARRLLQEVDALASSYGWTEAEILALSRTRRQTYLEIRGLT